MRNLAIILTIFLAQFFASAVTVSTTAGALSTKVSDRTITALTVRGTMDARDFLFINEELPSLKTLNLSGVTIAQYKPTDPMFFGTLEFPAGEIPAKAFFGKGYTSVTLPTLLRSIGDGAFAACSSLTTITLPSSLVRIGNEAFNASALHNVTIPAFVTEMGARSFAGCPSLTRATVNGTVVGKEAFANCPALTTVTLANSVKVFGDGAFSGTGNITVSIASESTLTEIGSRAFQNSGISSFPFSSLHSLSKIGSWAFAGSALSEVALGNTVREIGEGAFFYNTNLTSVALPRTISNVASFLFAGDNNVANDSVLLKGHVTVGDYVFYNWDQHTRFVVSSTVQEIGSYAMAGMRNLKKLYAYPRRVPTLGEEVWKGVNQPRANLYVYGTMVDAFESAPQWMDFGNIFPYKLLIYDINSDGVVDVTDVVLLAEYVLGDLDADNFDLEAADIDGSGVTDVNDVVALAGIVMGN